MTKRLDFPVDADGNIVAWKVIVGCNRGRYLSGRTRPFPDRAFNWVGENAVLVHVKPEIRRIRGQAFPLDDPSA